MVLKNLQDSKNIAFALLFSGNCVRHFICEQCIHLQDRAVTYIFHLQHNSLLMVINLRVSQD
jgi:hypothetical protein